MCKMAVFPLQLIATNPLPSGFLPKVGPGKAKGWIYPDEDAKLVASPDVPVEYRFFYGFLHREGPRISEAERLTWDDFDLERGSIVLDVNKTNDPRAWALSSGVPRGLRAWRTFLSSHGVSTKGTDLVFVDLHGESVNKHHSAERYREHLFAAGITRSVLFERTDTRQQIRAHDTRATFVTVSLANGKSEAWVQDRTGHKSSLMINRYKRAARTAAELHLGDFKPLDEAIPELARLLADAPTAEPATAKTPRFADDSSAADPRNSPAETDPKGRIVSGIVSNSEPDAPDAPESDVENLMISASSPTRDRTGTTFRSRDFKFDKGDSSRRDPCDSAGFDEASQRLDAAVANSDDIPEGYFDTSRLLSDGSADATQITAEQLAALANNPQLVGLLQAMAVMMGGVKGGGGEGE
jgi:hypothetical protein